MNFKRFFLQLSIRHQILFMVLFIFFMTLLSILALFSVYTKCLVLLQCQRAKSYFFDIYDDIMYSNIRFQNLLLFQYEQLIKTFNNQIFYYGKSQNDLYEVVISYKESVIKNYEETTQDDYQPDSPEDEKVYYLYCFTDDLYLCNVIKYLLASTHLSIDNQLKAIRNFRVPYFGNTPIINEYVFVPLSKKTIYSINRTRILEIDESSNGNFTSYYEKLVDNHLEKYKKYLNDFKSGNILFLDILYNTNYFIFENYVNENYMKTVYKNDVKQYIYDVSNYFQELNYSTEKTFVIDNGNKNDVGFLDENSIIENYINFIFTSFLKFTNINSIPVFPENNTIMSVDLCYIFLIKQFLYIQTTDNDVDFDLNDFKKIYSTLEKGKSNVGHCILGKKYYPKSKQNLYDVLNIVFLKFYNIKNKRDYSYFTASDTPLGSLYYCYKYTFPDYSSIIDFKPEFLTLEQINIYSFHTLYEPYSFYYEISYFYYYWEYFIIILIILDWLILFFYIIIRLQKLFKEIIEPINDLIKAMENLDIKQGNVLKYEPDDSINELFKLCNSLLLGKYKKDCSNKYMPDTNIIENNNESNVNHLNNMKTNQRLIDELIEKNKDFEFNEKEIFTLSPSDFILKNKKELRVGFSDERQKKYKSYNKNYFKSCSVKSIDLPNHNDSIDVPNPEENINEEEYNNKEGDVKRNNIINYKLLHKIADTIQNYEINQKRKLVPKFVKGDNKSNSFRKTGRRNFTNKISNNNSSSNHSSSRRNIQNTIEEFDKKIVNSYRKKNLLFLWYMEEKHFKGLDIINLNFEREINEICGINKLKKEKLNVNDEINQDNNKQNFMRMNSKYAINTKKNPSPLIKTKQSSSNLPFNNLNTSKKYTPRKSRSNMKLDFDAFKSKNN